MDIPSFGNRQVGAEYTLRPGGYAIIVNEQKHVACVATPMGLYLPGGGQDPGETPELAAIREVLEECGCTIKLGQRLGVADEFAFGKAENTYFQKRCTFFLAKLIEKVAPGEADHQLTWVPLQESVLQLNHGSQRWAVGEAIRVLRS